MASQNHHTGNRRDSIHSEDVVRHYGVQSIPTDAQPTADLREYIDGNHDFDQGQLGSSSASAVCSAYELVVNRAEKMQKLPVSNFKCSRMFVYYNSRALQNNTEQDTGASLRNTFQAIRDSGVCQESVWSYDISKFAVKPSDAIYESAEGNNIIKYERLGPHMQQFKACLNDGFPFVFGFKIFNGFRSLENDKGGMLAIPSEEEIASTPEPETQAGLAVGYNDASKCITVLNSWGKSFGDNGFFYMPYDYISNRNLCFDFWTIVEAKEKVPTPSSEPTPAPTPAPTSSPMVNLPRPLGFFFIYIKQKS